MKYKPSRVALRVIFVVSLAYFIGLGFVVNRLTIAQDLLVWAIAMIPLYFAYRSWPVVLEASITPLIWLIMIAYLPRQGAVWYLPFTAPGIIMISHRLRTRAATRVSMLFIAGWTVLALYTNSIGITEGVILAVTLIWVGSYIFDAVSQADSGSLQKIDVILCSFSGNTGHYTRQFIDALQENGKAAAIYRFHRKEEFKPVLGGDALALAFPVSGWKPPWHLTEYLIKDLPRGNGKPAFILYTAAGGPENAGFAAWIILTLKGYKVRGRAWSIYPMNVPTFRLGPKAFCSFIDSLTPLKNDTGFIIKAAREFSNGERAGMPFILWPTPLTILGILFDNRWVNKYLYRTYVWRKRCTKCNFCVRYCPVYRFNTDSGLPKAQGTCALCFGCVNHCPKNAMHMRFWTEYGQPYKARWPQYIYKE